MDFGAVGMYAASQQAMANAQGYGQLYGLGGMGGQRGACGQAGGAYPCAFPETTIEQMERDVKAMLKDWDI